MNDLPDAFGDSPPGFAISPSMEPAGPISSPAKRHQIQLLARRVGREYAVHTDAPILCHALDERLGLDDPLALDARLLRVALLPRISGVGEKRGQRRQRDGVGARRHCQDAQISLRPLVLDRN